MKLNCSLSPNDGKMDTEKEYKKLWGRQFGETNVDDACYQASTVVSVGSLLF
jgi:hypothetical protein